MQHIFQLKSFWQKKIRWVSISQLRTILLCFAALFLVASLSLAKAPVTEKKNERFVFTDSTVYDTQTHLMWATQGNGEDISWHEADSYCRKFNGGGYSDWRMPTQKELKTLFDLEAGKNAHYYIAGNIKLTGCCVWASDKSGAKVASFDFDYGNPDWGHPDSIIESRALPVRRVQ